MPLNSQNTTPGSPAPSDSEAASPSSTNPASSGTPAPPAHDVLKSALKAFKKRIKLTRLDEESKLGYGPMTGGGRSNVVAITPPNQFPRAVWDELVKQGKLKSAGQGFYRLVE
ncbi:MAG: hypothetical protein WD042_12220 [Phycisphaeraceae bacterium]